MKRNITLLFFCLAIAGAVQAQLCTTCPTDNPIATHYGDSGDYAFWTDEIMWNVVIDMSTYSNGANDYEKFKNARDYLYDTYTGGVLYYPAGTYRFTVEDNANGEGLMLKKGVVIRGATPSSDKSAVTNYDIESVTATDHGLNSLPTKFYFKRTMNPMGKTLPDSIPTMWSMVGAKTGSGEAHLGEVSHVGIAWVEINYGYVFFGNGNNTWADSFAVGKYYGNSAIGEWRQRVPNGTHPWDNFCGLTVWGADTALHGEKRFVFGCNLKNSVTPNYGLNRTSQTNFICDDGGYKWFARIGVYGKHVFVANNVIAKPTHSFIYQQNCKSGGQISGLQNLRFDYGDCIGIDINKSSMSGFWNRCTKDENSGFYPDDVIMQDNWIYNHGNKGCEIAGKWVVAKGNVNFKEWLGVNDVYGISTPAGIMDSDGRCYNATNVADFQARAFDIGGWNVWIHNNRYTGTGSIGNDGEGILIQRHNGVDAWSFAYTYNMQGSAGENGYLAPYDVHCIGLFHGWNTQRGAIGINKVDVNWCEDVACPQGINWNLLGDSVAPSGVGGTNVKDFMANCGSVVTAVDTVLNLSVILDVINYKTVITYTDNSSDEIAYRIEKRPYASGDPWTVIAYRPRQQTTTTADLGTISTTVNYGPAPVTQCWPTSITIDEMNPAMWVDFKANPGEVFEYRVVTIDCDNDAAGATGVKIISKAQIATSPVRNLLVKVVPNPVTGSAIISYNLPEGQTASVDIMDMNGRVVLNLAHGSYAPSVTLPAGALKKGTYLVKVLSSGGSGVIDKFIVQ